MQDEQEPFFYLQGLSEEILRLTTSLPTPRFSPVRRQGSAHYLFTIDESQEYKSEEFGPRFDPTLTTKDLKTEILQEMANDSQFYYDLYKCLVVELSYIVGQKEKKLLQILNYKLQGNANSSCCNRVCEVMRLWQKERPDFYIHTNADTQVRRVLLVQIYLYHIALENVFFEYLGLVDDPILKKLFSQGIVVYALIDLYFRDEPQLLGYLTSIGVPLALRFDNSLLNLNQGKDWSYSRPIRNWTTDFNLYRLTITRLRRLWLTLNDLHCFQDVSIWMMICDPVVQISMRFLNLVYFIPRLTTQFLCFFKHLFITAWMTEQEKQMTFFQRFMIQLNRRWEICFRDSLWCLNSLLNFFVLTGVHASWSLVLNATLQLIETCLNIYLYYDFVDQNKKRNFLLKNIKPEALLQIQLMDALEEKSRYIRMINSILILLSNVLVLHFFFVLNPFIPILGATVGLMMSFIQMSTRVQLENERMAFKEVFELPQVYPKESSIKFLINEKAHNAKISKANWLMP